MLRSTYLLLATSLSLASAQSQSVLSLPFYGYDQFPIDASVIAVQDSATTLSIQCPPGTDGSDCGLALTQTFIYGPSTYHMDVNEAPAFTMTQDCSLAGTTEAVCMESAGGGDANFPGSSTTTYSSSDILYMPVTVTSGVDLLGAAGAGTSSPNTTPAPGSTGGSSSAVVTSTDASTSSPASSLTSDASTGTVTSAAPTTAQSSLGAGAGSVASSATSSGAATVVGIGHRDTAGAVGSMALLLSYLFV